MCIVHEGAILIQWYAARLQYSIYFPEFTIHTQPWHTRALSTLLFRKTRTCGWSDKSGMCFCMMDRVLPLFSPLFCSYRSSLRSTVQSHIEEPPAECYHDAGISSFSHKISRWVCPDLWIKKAKKSCPVMYRRVDQKTRFIYGPTMVMLGLLRDFRVDTTTTFSVPVAVAYIQTATMNIDGRVKSEKINILGKYEASRVTSNR